MFKILKKTSVLVFISLLFVTSVTFAAEKTLKIGTDCAFPPFEFFDEKRQPVGFDVDLIKAMAKVAGYQPDIQVMDFNALIPRVRTKILDCAIAGFSITKERKGYISFSKPYFKTNKGEKYGIVVGQENPELLEELNRALVILRKNGTYDEIVSKWFKNR